MLDAVDSAASDIRKAVSTLPAAITDIQATIRPTRSPAATNGSADGKTTSVRRSLSPAPKT